MKNYRFYDNQYKQMIYSNDKEFETISQFFKEYEDRIENARLMESTGLLDKKGKEIYEGDILKICNGSINGIEWPEPNREVKLMKNGSGFNLHSFMWDKNGINIMDSTHYCFVIGDTYNDAELLSVSAKTEA